MARYVGYFGNDADRRRQGRAIARLLRRVLARPLGRIQRAAERRTADEMADALSRPPSQAPVWALRALAVGEAASDGAGAVVRAAFEAVHGDPRKLRKSLTTRGQKRR